MKKGKKGKKENTAVSFRAKSEDSKEDGGETTQKEKECTRDRGAAHRDGQVPSSL